MITVVLTARPSYAKIRPLLTALVHAQVPTSVTVCASALLERYGRVVDQVRADFPDLPVHAIYSTLEGSSFVTTAKDAGLLLLSLSDHFAATRPTLVFVMADRYETLAATMAASYQRIPVIHAQGGERSGNLDDRVRDANTALATYHFPATELAALRVYGQAMGGWATIKKTGCPSIDVAKAAQDTPRIASTDVLGGLGPRLDLTYPFLLFLMHSENLRPEEAFWLLSESFEATVRAAATVRLPILALWPGHDAGAELGAKALRIVTAKHPEHSIHSVRTIPPLQFLRLLGQAACLVGNSSAGIREASYLGTPVVNIGDRQTGRERGPNVVTVDRDDVYEAILRQTERGKYQSSLLYGNGTAAPQMVRHIQEWLA